MYVSVSIWQSSKPFLFLLCSVLAIESSMSCSSIWNKSIGEVGRPTKVTAEKNLHNINHNVLDHCKLDTFNLQQYNG